MIAKNVNAVPSEPAEPVPVEDEARAGVYALMGALLRDRPAESLLSTVRGLGQADGRDDFALAWEGVRLAAEQVMPPELDLEYHRLFIGLGRGELVPYGSWYQTGFLMEKPLGALRRDLHALGLERQPGVHEPEDHVAALCEAMAELASDPLVPFEAQRDFYRSHLGPWVERFCEDLESAESAVFYKSVARLGTAFFELERRYLEMET
jgi:TorA maturation chaperone TorD